MTDCFRMKDGFWEFENQIGMKLENSKNGGDYSQLISQKNCNKLTFI